MPINSLGCNLFPLIIFTKYYCKLQMLSAYARHVTTRPVLTKALTAGALNGLQELIAAKATGSRLDARAFKMAAYGFLVSGPLAHYLYRILETRFKKGNLAAKLIAANLVITPILNFVYLTALAFFSGASLQQSMLLARQRLAGILKISWSVFPLVQMLAFSRLSPEMHVPFFNLVAFVFGTVINIKTKLNAKKRL